MSSIKIIGQETLRLFKSDSPRCEWVTYCRTKADRMLQYARYYIHLHLSKTLEVYTSVRSCGFGDAHDHHDKCCSVLPATCKWPKRRICSYHKATVRPRTCEECESDIRHPTSVRLTNSIPLSHYNITRFEKFRNSARIGNRPNFKLKLCFLKEPVYQSVRYCLFILPAGRNKCVIKMKRA